MSRRLDEKQAAVDTGILDITVTLGSEFLAEVCRMLVLDVLHNRVPTECVISSIRTVIGQRDYSKKYHLSLLTWSP